MYKKLIILFTIICLGRSFANSQQIVITIPANPPANTSSWATSTPPFSITVTGTAQLAETNMLVFIKSASGNVVCGSNQAAAAQPTNIRPGQPKAWVGNNALALLGDNCVLPTGSYQLCVQIFGLKQDASGTKPIIEKCVPFEIRSVECTAPTPISPAHQKKFTISELKQNCLMRFFQTGGLAGTSENWSGKQSVEELSARLEGTHWSKLPVEMQIEIVKQVLSITFKLLN